MSQMSSHWSACSSLPTMAAPPVTPPKRLNLMPRVTRTVARVCDEFDLRSFELRSPTRLRRYVHARHLLFWLLRTGHGLSLLEIGMLTERDHTTVMSGLKSHERRMARDERWRVVSVELLRWVRE